MCSSRSRLNRRNVPVVINVALNEYLVCEPNRKLTSRTPHVEHLNIYGIVFLVREPYRCEVHSVIVGRVFVLLEYEAAVDLFKQAIVKRSIVAVVIKLREQNVCCLASGAVLCIPGEVCINVYLNSIAGFHGILM